MTVFLYTVGAIVCLGAIGLYNDWRKEFICGLACAFLLMSVALELSPLGLSDPRAMVFNGCATFTFSALLMILRAHYLLLSVCFLALCSHSFGYLIAISAVLADVSVYNNLVLLLDLLFVFLILALSDAGIIQLSTGSTRARTALLLLLDRGKMGN